MRCERRMRPTSRGVNNLDIFNFGTGGVRTVYEKSIGNWNWTWESGHCFISRWSMKC